MKFTEYLVVGLIIVIIGMACATGYFKARTDLAEKQISNWNRLVNGLSVEAWGVGGGR